MSQVGRGPKVLVAAAFAPSSLLLLGASGAAASVLGLLVWGWLAPLVAGAGALAYLGQVLALANDPAFAQAALEAGDLGASSLGGARRLEVLARFGKLPPGLHEKTLRLQDLGAQVEARLASGAGGPYAGALRALAPQLRETLDEAVDVVARQVEGGASEAGAVAASARLDRIVEILESIQGDLITMDSGTEALGGDDMVLRLEDLSGEVSVLKESLDELEG